MTKVIVLKNTDFQKRPDLVGQWLDESHYHTLVEEDIDLYLPPPNSVDGSSDDGINEKNIVFKFRKNYFSKELVKSAYDGLREAAGITENRGIASGIKAGMDKKEDGRDWITNYQFDIMDSIYENAGESLLTDEVDYLDEIRAKYPTKESRLKSGGTGRNNVWVIERFRNTGFNFESWVDNLKPLSRQDRIVEVKKIEEYISDTTYGNPVHSGIAGWYDRYPRIPYGRPTSYTENNPDKFSKSYPYLQALADGFKELLPWRYNNQMEATSRIDPKFVVPNTPFTTITVNKNFRTAAHYDPANMEDGFANLCVVSNNDNYRGAYLVFPEIGYAVNIRPGDLLFVNNQAGLHGNTEIFFDDPEAERISMIAFFHEKMLKLGEFDYEQLRKEYVNECKNNINHPFYRNRFNGVFPGMWSDTELEDYTNAKGWYDKLKAHPKGDVWLEKHHPWLKNNFEANNSLESFF